MGSRRFGTRAATALATGAAVATGCLALGVVAAPAGFAPASVSPAVELAALRQANEVIPLRQFRTPRNAGWFYTLSDAEARSAASRYSFSPQGSVGHLHPGAGPGLVALYRLRSKAQSSYLVTGSTAERDNLVRSGRFVNERILGYIDAQRQPGFVRLVRLSNHGQWRLALESQAGGLQRAGYTLDGPVGWVRP